MQPLEEYMSLNETESTTFHDQIPDFVTENVILEYFIDKIFLSNIILDKSLNHQKLIEKHLNFC